MNNFKKNLHEQPRVTLHVTNTFLWARPRSCWSSALFSVPLAVFISMPIARRCVPTVWKGPAAVHAKSLFWRTRWAKNMAASIRFPLRHLSVMTGRKQEWNKPLYILIICSAPSPNWNDGKITPPDDRRWRNLSVLYLCISLLPSLHHASPPPPPPPPTGHMCCSAVL